MAFAIRIGQTSVSSPDVRMCYRCEKGSLLEKFHTCVGTCMGECPRVLERDFICVHIHNFTYIGVWESVLIVPIRERMYRYGRESLLEREILYVNVYNYS